MNASVDPAFRAIADLVREHAAARPEQAALVQGEVHIGYAQLDALMDRIAATLQRDGLRPGDTVAICAHSTPWYAAVFLGALRAGVAVAPLAPSVTADQFASMLADAGAKLLFADGAAAPLLAAGPMPRTIALDATLAGHAAGRLAGRRRAACRSRWRRGPSGRSTSSIPAAPPARRRASCSRTACAGPT